MPIILYRVDERLIHGQVVVGWGAALHPTRMVVVDDELAASAWEQELYTLGLPPDIEGVFASVGEARAALEGWEAEDARTILLTRDVRTMRSLMEGAGLDHAEVNLGGIHYAPGRERVLPYLFLSEEERTELRALAAGGARVSAQDVPRARKVDAQQLFGSDA
ncbi:MAG TPA: PTS sugar transporter subunit IIB [Longimicrobiales bacterium]|nr:PTS sugar transporter subunit IIB [Longimicrobiales bacterium]